MRSSTSWACGMISGALLVITALRWMKPSRAVPGSTQTLPRVQPGVALALHARRLRLGRVAARRQERRDAVVGERDGLRGDVAAEEAVAALERGDGRGPAPDERIADDEARLGRAAEHRLQELDRPLGRVGSGMDPRESPDVRHVAPRQLAIALGGEDNELVASAEIVAHP